MKIFPTTWYHKKSNNYFIKPTPCYFCKNLMIGVCYIKIFWSTKQTTSVLFCPTCIPKIKKYEVIGLRLCEVSSLIAADIIPKSAFQTIWDPNKLGNGRYEGGTVFNLAYKHSPGVRVNDYTKLAGRESFEGARIGKSQSQLLEEQNKEVGK